ncbi:MAG: alpha/beta fold hydrolase [Metamycoplasmataceae bacterium]
MKKNRKDIKIPNIEEEIPFYFKGNFQNEKCFIFIPGLGGEGGSILNYLNLEEDFPNYCSVSFDMRGQGENKNKPSKYFQKYLSDVNNIINYLLEKYQFSEIILGGESWGSALAFLYQNKYHKKEIKKVIGWNMPFSIIKNEEKEKTMPSLISNFKILLTYLTNITTYEERPFNEKLTNNEVVIRINQNKNNKQNNKLPIAAWKSFKKAYRIYFKNKEIMQYHYIQSLDDVLRTNSFIEKNAKNMIILEKGTHILSLDKFEKNNLFKTIKEIINS